MTARARAVVALLLMLLMPLSLLHRSSSEACLYDHGAVGSGTVATLSDVRHDVTSSAAADQVSATAASLFDVSAVDADSHDHHGADLPLHGATSGACGPAAVSAYPMIASVHRTGAALPVWRAEVSLALAVPPPAPPPRLS